MNQRVTTHYTHHSIKSMPSSRCMCCWDDHTKHREQRKDLPKLIPSPYMSVRRTPSPDLDDSVRVSVIKKPDHPDVPLRKLSVNSHHSDKNSDDMTEHRRSVSPSYHPYDLAYTRRNIYENYPASTDIGLIKRKKLTILQNDNEYRRSHYNGEGYVNYREIPSPGYPTSPRYLVESASPEPPQFAFGPYMESALRNKYRTDITQFPDLSRGIKKRHRTIFTPSQLRKLEEKFNECNFIVGEDRQMLATQLKLKEHQVKIWFQNRRTKVKQTAKGTPNAASSEIDVVS